MSVGGGGVGGGWGRGGGGEGCVALKMGSRGLEYETTVACEAVDIFSALNGPPQGELFDLGLRPVIQETTENRPDIDGHIRVVAMLE